MRNNDVKKAGQIISQIISNTNKSNTYNQMKPINEITKQELWKAFLKTFKEMYNKEFHEDKNVINNLKPLFFYFLRDEKFFDCLNLNKDISEPSFKKGVMLMGGYGLGKTDYMKVFENIFKNYTNLRFKFYTSKSLVLLYEISQTPMDKESFFKDTERKLMFIDDISSERIASNYGHIDVIDEVLINRYDKNLITFVSCNYTTNNNCAKQTLQDLGLRYGGRMYDRFHEMFNIIEFKGSSFRR
jgi:DNA replication protein DnaC